MSPADVEALARTLRTTGERLQLSWAITGGRPNPEAQLMLQAAAALRLVAGERDRAFEAQHDPRCAGLAERHQQTNEALRSALGVAIELRARVAELEALLADARDIIGTQSPGHTVWLDAADAALDEVTRA